MSKQLPSKELLIKGRFYEMEALIDWAESQVRVPRSLTETVKDCGDLRGALPSIDGSGTDYSHCEIELSYLTQGCAFPCIVVDGRRLLASSGVPSGGAPHNHHLAMIASPLYRSHTSMAIIDYFMCGFRHMQPLFLIYHSMCCSMKAKHGPTKCTAVHFGN